MKREFTSNERAFICQAFIAAKSHLWDGVVRTDYVCGDKEKYICYAITRGARFWIGDAWMCATLAKEEVVQARLEGFVSMESWLKSKGVANGKRTGYSNAKKMQAHRLAWLNMLIEEFSK